MKLTYASGIEMFHGGPSGCTFEGTEGTLYVDRGKIESTPVEIASRMIGENDQQVYRADNHHRNWLDCVRSRKPTICPAEIGHRSATVCHLTNIGYQLRRKLAWDPVAECFDDEEANRLAAGEMRSPGTLQS